jgi:hypothetical protein
MTRRAHHGRAAHSYDSFTDKPPFPPAAQRLTYEGKKAK